jgi:enoyl-CoA hydratase
MDGAVESERRDGVLTLTFARPDKANALSPAMVEQLRGGIAQGLAGDVRVLVLAARGKHFCAGGDMAYLGTDDEDSGVRYITSVTEAIRDLRRFPKPIVAAVQGYAVGAGAELACESDVLVMAASARLGFPDVSIGSTPATVQSIVRLAGRGTAAAIVLLGRELDAARAELLGVAAAVVPDAQLAAHVAGVADALAAQSPLAVAFAKRALQAAESSGPMDELDVNLEAELRCFVSEEMRARVRAFRQP